VIVELLVRIVRHDPPGRHSLEQLGFDVYDYAAQQVDWMAARLPWRARQPEPADRGLLVRERRRDCTWERVPAISSAIDGARTASHSCWPIESCTGECATHALTIACGR